MANPRLKNWSIRSNSGPYMPPELLIRVLVGEVYNHPAKRHYNGKLIQTSTIQELNLKKGVAKTRNTIYELGKPDEEWLAWLRENGYNEIEDFLKGSR